MSRRRRNAGPARESQGKGPAVALSNDAADLEAAAEMLEAAVLRETGALREEEAMRQAEESLAATLHSGVDEVNADADATGSPDSDELDDEAAETRDPYAVLAEYERRSFAHVVASADQVQAPGLWRGIAFRIGTRRLMASITEVSEILPVLHHTSVPGTQPWLLGVVNVRGTLVPLVDLRGYIEGERTPLGDTSRMLVARHGSNAIGLLVEEVLGQRNLTAENDPLKLENDAANWARFVPAHFDLDGKLWGVFSMAALVAAPDFLHAAA